MRKAAIAVLVLVLALLVAYLAWRRPAGGPGLAELLESVKTGERIKLRVAGREAGTVDVKYTCDGVDVSPPVEWRGVPEGARSLVLICYDPDAPRGIFVHWVLFNIPPSLTSLPEGLPRRGLVEGVGVHGRNDFGFLGYGGPCPPSGTHRYVFLLLALDRELGLREGATAADVLREARGHVLGYGEVVLRYGKG